MGKKKIKKIKAQPFQKNEKLKEAENAKLPENPDYGGIPMRDLKKNLGCG